jgi:hypothetical protein
MSAGEVGEAIRKRLPSSTSFPRECGKQTKSGRPDSLALANLQLRDSVGFTPTSPRSGQYFVACILCGLGGNVNALRLNTKQRKKNKRNNDQRDISVAPIKAEGKIGHKIT